MVLADELDEFLRLGFPILGEAFEVFEDGMNTSGREESYCILGVFVEVCVEDALILEVGLPVDLEDLPAQIVQLERGEAVWVLGNRFLNRLGVFVAGFLTAGDQLCDDGEAVTRGSPGEDRAVASLFGLAEVTSLWDRYRDGFRPVFCFDASDMMICLSLVSGCLLLHFTIRFPRRPPFACLPSNGFAVSNILYGDHRIRQLSRIHPQSREGPRMR